jgi:hypothetical protein
MGVFAPTAFLWENQYLESSAEWHWNDTSMTRKCLVGWIVLLVIAIGANCIHLVATILEYYFACTTSLCLNESGYLWSFLWLLFFVLVLDIVLLTRVAVYRQDLWLLHRATMPMISVPSAPPGDEKGNLLGKIGHRLRV